MREPEQSSWPQMAEMTIEAERKNRDAMGPR